MRMILSRTVLLALIAHLSLFQETDCKFVDGSNFQNELRSYEIVTPQLQTQGRWRRDISTRSSSGDHVGRAVFYLRGFGKDFLLDVSQNRILLSANYITRSFDADGGEVIGRHEKNETCFYQGTVQGLQHSIVAITTCQGMEGMVYDGNETYFIQPLPGNPDQHIMYRSRDMIQGHKRCGVDHSSSIPDMQMSELISHGKHRARRNIESETKYVELIIVNDYSQYVDLNRQIAAVELRSKSIANVVDSLYRSIHIRIALTMVEVWSQRDLIHVVEDSDACLDNFMDYRNKHLYKKQKHDNAMLLTHRSFKGSTVGKAAVLAMCGRKSGGVVQDYASSTAATAAIMAHEMGHNFGMLHDEDIKDCKCNAPAENQGCIMSAVAKSKPSTEWSSCSVDSYYKYLKRGMDACLFNTPSSLFGDAVCGNGFKEEGEECDCGTVEECEKHSDGCCNATTCKLLSYAECDTGPCCGSCKLKPQGSLCRDKVNECDLPEFCTGKSELCPNNKYVQDGRPCANNKGYCYKGECPTHDEQCQDLWGPEAVSGPDGCYKINEQGTVWGNCHQPGNNVYLKCAPKDKLCGMLQCTGIKEVRLPVIGTERSAYNQYYGPTLCKSASLSLGLDVPDPGETVEGTKCGEDKLCLDRKCESIETLTSVLKKCPNNCSNENGICNNEAECFCLSCWQDPDCSVWVECRKGNGTDQNLVTPTANITEIPEGTQEPQTEKRSKLAGILIAVFLCIFLVVGAVVAFYYREQLMRKWRAYKQKAPGTNRYQGVSNGSPKQRRAHNAAGAHAKTDLEAAKPRPNISGPTLTSTTRNKPDVTVSTNPLGQSRLSNGAAKQDRQPLVALKPTPPKPEKPAVEKVETIAKYPPPKLRNAEWPPIGDKKASLNRASGPPGAGKPVHPVKPFRPQSHAGVLGKPPVPAPPPGREPVKPAKPRRPESHAGTIDKPEPGKPVKPRRPESHAGMIDKPQPLRPVKPRRPESHAGILDKPAVPSPPGKTRPPQRSTSGQKEDTDGSKAPPSQPKVPFRPPLRPVDARFPKPSTEERPASLPLKPSDLKKAGLAAGTKKPSSFSTADNKPKKVPLKPPGPIPSRPGAK